MGRISDHEIEEVRGAADIVDVIGAHVRLRKAGRNFVGLCPFHNEKTPSFTVSRERGFFHCFGCGAGGTVFNFLMRHDGMTFPEAVRALAERYGIKLSDRGDRGPPADQREAMQRASLVASEFYARVLWDSEEGASARRYLEVRGISESTSRMFMLGCAPGRPASLAAALKRRGLTEAGLAVGLLRRGEGGLHDMFRARLMFPIRDPQGRVIGFGGRVLDDRLPKYINSPESPLYSKARSLYGLFESRRTIASEDRVLLVEGYFDVVGLWEAGLHRAVASLGTAVTIDQLRRLARYTKNVTACFDGDEAGRKASLRAFEVFLGAGLLGRAIFLPAGSDPDTLVRERGAGAIQELEASAGLLVDYYIRTEAQAAGSSLEARARAAERVAEMLRRMSNPFEFNLLARRAADILKVGEDVLRGRGRAGRAVGGRGRPGGPPPPPASGAARAEAGLIAIALLREDLRGEVFEAIRKAGLEASSPGRLLEAIGHEESGPVAIEPRLSAVLSNEQQSILSELAVDPILSDPALLRERIRDYVLAIDERRRRRAIDELRSDSAGMSEVARVQQALDAARALDDLRRKRGDKGAG